MDGDAYAGESATLDEFRILEDMPSAVNDHGPPRVKDVVTDAVPAEADAPDAEQASEQAGDPAAEHATQEASEQASPPAAEQATQQAPRQPTGAATDVPPDGPRDEPPPPVTGDDAVDAATAEVADTAADPLEARLAAYERAHRTLQDRLADVES